jgi:hypothetical protein
LSSRGREGVTFGGNAFGKLLSARPLSAVVIPIHGEPVLLRLTAQTSTVGISLQGLASATGLSKTAIQRAVTHLKRRAPITVCATGQTHASRYTLLRPWARDGNPA